MSLTEPHFLAYHKQATSARTLFLRMNNGSVMLPEPFPFLSSPLEPGEVVYDNGCAQLEHPATLGQRFSTVLGLPPESVEVETDFIESVEIPSGTVTVYLARLKAMDPPRAHFAETGAGFYPITELRGGHPVEMDLLRKAYEFILGG
ncbi:hypothetical protein F6R98_04535 [Candidatus Methylospira mobilis]|uniref:Uncharacterized protein n=1 Tax=Candidatus Methylospira mobilis TaxID=1808979 RepID=A0A5Q0BIN0_9GAMM|nr:hypothetical protein [Candidatus Methylospira mobilis]QFY41988.1 hypothetical protein F6R98_04535 [Candidatus Methylospira mobilis]WNV02980.1 hypothetical protein RP726_10895 [Candidatus Methylospira mobilis]